MAADNAQKFTSLTDVDVKGVRIGVNPGGTNENFVKETMKHAEFVIFEDNLVIPQAVAAKEVDVMITDSVEALYYAATDTRLAALV